MVSVTQQWPLVLATGIVLMNVEQSGVTLGWSSPVLARLQSENSTIPTTSNEGAWIASALPLASLFATGFSALSMHYLGRKFTIAVTAVPYITSWIIIALATTTTELIIARAIAGIASAFTYTVTPVYLGEISPDNIRGGIGLSISVVGNIGTLWIYCIGTIPELWFSSLLSALPIFAVLVFYLWLPESPYFLIEKNRKEEAVNALKKLRNKDNVDDEIKQMELTISENSKQNLLKELFTDPSHRRALVIALGTLTFAQFTGGITFLFYAHLIFKRAGNVSANLMSIVKAVMQLLTSIGSAYVVDNVGKRPLLIISCIGSAFFMACEGIYFYLLDYGYNVQSIWWLPLVSMILFNVSQVIGLVSISIAFFGELFHPKVKPISVCISKGYLSLSVFIVGKLFQIMTDSLGNSIPFFVFAVIGVLGLIFIVKYVPETKGRSLEEIQYYMKHQMFRENSIS